MIKDKSHWGLLLLWILVGAGLRFTNLELKAPWADEWATLVFSLGNSFKTIPLEQIISLDTLLQPLQLRSETSTQDVVTYLMGESTHPPVYFVLTHIWLKLLGQEGLVSLNLARSLSAWLGVLGIPAIFALSKLISGSKKVAQFAAALMAVSPYGIYLAQETRHYTLAILWVMASLACLVITVKYLEAEKPPSIPLILIWIIINSLGVATHYFFALALVTEILVLSIFYWREIKEKKSWLLILFTRRWRRINWAILGTIAGCLIWVWTWSHIPDSQLTDWTGHGDPWGKDFFEPLGRLVAWITTMIFLLPIEGTSLNIAILSGLIIVLFVILLLIGIWKYWHYNEIITNVDLTKKVVGQYILFALGLILAITYIGENDITLAARFQFFYFPSILLLIAAILNYIWEKASKYESLLFGKKLVVATLLLGLCGGLVVINNYGYQKPDRPDLVASGINQAQSINPEVPILVATVHKTHEQTGEMMGIAWEWNKQQSADTNHQPQFLLLHKDGDETVFRVTQGLHNNLDKLARPLDLWVVNFSAPTDLEPKNCFPDEEFKLRSPGYRHRLYHCY
ncbi:MAG: glycosyltransferase [Xenococcaceae cyanobacterium MO_188.B19]|nr:glycosyltransferase [Xenococcaceae cyanobacterium MO_188.B19]